MKFYNNIFICYYNMFIKANDFNPRLGALMLILVLQFFHLIVILRITQNLTGIQNKQLPSEYFILIFFFVYMIILLRYYTKNKIKSLLEEFNEKTDHKKAVWKNFSIITFISSFILLIIVLKK